MAQLHFHTPPRKEPNFHHRASFSPFFLYRRLSVPKDVENRHLQKTSIENKSADFQKPDCDIVGSKFNAVAA